jgi:hypothetical protein
VSILGVLLTYFSCGYVKCSIQHKGDGLRFTICAYYSWQMTVKVGLDVSFDNMYGKKEIRENAEEVNST